MSYGPPKKGKNALTPIMRWFGWKFTMETVRKVDSILMQVYLMAYKQF